MNFWLLKEQSSLEREMSQSLGQINGCIYTLRYFRTRPLRVAPQKKERKYLVENNNKK